MGDPSSVAEEDMVQETKNKEEQGTEGNKEHDQGAYLIGSIRKASAKGSKMNTSTA